MKYGDCANRAFLVMTISLCISEFFTIIGFDFSAAKNQLKIQPYPLVL
jgi:hypothetical protein